MSSDAEAKPPTVTPTMTSSPVQDTPVVNGVPTSENTDDLIIHAGSLSSGLARAVGAEKTKHLAGGDLEVEVEEAVAAAVVLGQAQGCDRRRHRRVPSRSSRLTVLLLRSAASAEAHVAASLAPDRQLRPARCSA